eukprot:TRINITY_DN3397_c0_g1_i1.p1 TRINITY_DN3397_c0_g1~~TRINITY_DN3397_c0_g1_i1.p1  ORF type:complete len:158 (+),score=3.49 TRINITY_DN3397_c0_g1_i1:821-1294(+)
MGVLNAHPLGSEYCTVNRIMPFLRLLGMHAGAASACIINTHARACPAAPIWLPLAPSPVLPACDATVGMPGCIWHLVHPRPHRRQDPRPCASFFFAFCLPFLSADRVVHQVHVPALPLCRQRALPAAHQAAKTSVAPAAVLPVLHVSLLCPALCRLL